MIDRTDTDLRYAAHRARIAHVNDEIWMRPVRPRGTRLRDRLGFLSTTSR